MNIIYTLTLLFIGFVVGVVAMCLFIISRRADNRIEVMRREK